MYQIMFIMPIFILAILIALTVLFINIYYKIINNRYDEQGYNKKGYDKNGYDKDGYREDGYNREGYNRRGYDKKGYNKQGYNVRGYDKDGYDKDGYNRGGFHKNGYELKKGISTFYLFEYYPKNRYYQCGKINETNRKILWEYKGYGEFATQYLTEQLLNAVVKISQNIPAEKIGLVAVPRSTSKLESNIAYSIRNIKKEYDNGNLSTKGFNKELFDFSDLLVRTTSVEASHLGVRPTADMHRSTIACKEMELPSDAAFLLMDDIMTTGTVMWVCKDKLIEHGVKSNNIYTLVIGQTVR